ncbi:MAG: TraB/GumN family protein [Stenotrophomonas sp.]
MEKGMRCMEWSRFAACLPLLMSMSAWAQGELPERVAAAADAVPIRDLETLVVQGVQPGPGLWKVSKDGHVMWVLGTVGPLPAGIEWQSGEVEATIARSSVVLSQPSFVLDADVGFFGMLGLAPQMWKALRNEDGARLEDVLPAELHARWLVQKQRYLGRDRGIERKRPMIAAGELRAAAIKSAGLERKSVLWPVLERALKVSGLKLTATKLKFTIDDPKAAVREFRAGGMDDTVCFERTLLLVERDMPKLVERANAWAMGDVEALRRLPLEDVDGACTQAFAASGYARDHGYGDLREKVRQHWLQIAGKALQDNDEIFAMLPVDDMLAADGYLARLQARGYEVEAP